MKSPFLNQAFIFTMLVISMSGCIRRKVATDRSFHSSKEDVSTLAKDCSEIEKEGDMLVVLQEIKNATQNIFMLLEVRDPTVNEQVVTDLSQNISENSQRAISLSRTAWTDSKWPYEIEWNLGEKDFKTLLGRFYRTNLEILSYEIHSVYLMGHEREDLKKDIILEDIGHGLQVKYKGEASSLEACQLQRALGIFLEVKFSDGKFIRSRFFNLIIDPTIMEIL